MINNTEQFLEGRRIQFRAIDEKDDFLIANIEMSHEMALNQRGGDVRDLVRLNKNCAGPIRHPSNPGDPVSRTEHCPVPHRKLPPIVGGVEARRIPENRVAHLRRPVGQIRPNDGGRQFLKKVGAAPARQSRTQSVMKQNREQRPEEAVYEQLCGEGRPVEMSGEILERVQKKEGWMQKCQERLDRWKARQLRDRRKVHFAVKCLNHAV
jgi:hypothetical protein